MNRILGILVIMAVSYSAMGQSPFFGLYGASHLATYNTSGDLRKVNKRLAIVYSRDYCWLFTPNGDKVAFRTRNYTKKLDTSRHSIHESFLNEDCQTTRTGFYTIMIDHLDDGVVLQVASPTGTMIVNHAEEFNENGRVKPGSMKVDWAGIRAARRKADSLQAVNARYREILINEVDSRRLYVDRQQATIPWLEAKLKEWKTDSIRRANPLH